MNGFKALSDTYKTAYKNGDMTEQDALKSCRIFDFLAECDKEDFNLLFDSGAFNQITMNYISLATKQLIEEDTVTTAQGNAIKKKVRDLFEDVAAGEIANISK